MSVGGLPLVKNPIRAAKRYVAVVTCAALSLYRVRIASVPLNAAIFPSALRFLPFLFFFFFISNKFIKRIVRGTVCTLARARIYVCVCVRVGLILYGENTAAVSRGD